MKNRCGDCLFYRPTEGKDAEGECRRNPPVIAEAMMSKWLPRESDEFDRHDAAWAASTWPVVDVDHGWCGEFKRTPGA